MKHFLIFITVFSFLTTNVWSDPFEAQDKEANKVAMFVREVLGADEFEKEILKNYPNGTFKWGGRVVFVDENGFTYLVYSEFNEPEKEPLYRFYEVKVAALDKDSELLKKYGLAE